MLSEPADASPRQVPQEFCRVDITIHSAEVKPPDQKSARRSGNGCRQCPDRSRGELAADRYSDEPKQRSAGGVQSIERAFTILEALAGNGGVMGLSALAADIRAAAADHSPPRPDAGRPWLPAAGAVPAVRAGAADPAAGREFVDDVERGRPAASGQAGRRPRRDRQPGVAGRRSDRLHLAGPVEALDADVHRGGPAGAAALHGRRQGDHGRHAGRGGARICCGAPECRGTPSTRSPIRTSSPSSCGGRPSTATPSTTANRNSACGASPSLSPASGRTLRCRCPVPAGRMTPETVDRAVPLLASAGRALAAELA